MDNSSIESLILEIEAEVRNFVDESVREMEQEIETVKTELA